MNNLANFKKILLPTFVFFISQPSYALTEIEWTNLINQSIQTKDDMTWDYNVDVLKSNDAKINKKDIPILKEIAINDDVQVAQGAKYILARQGDVANQFFFENFIKDTDIKNGLYYFNMNFVNTIDKDNIWDLIKKEETLTSASLTEEFRQCDNYKDYYIQGGKDFTFEDYNDFYSQRDVISNYTTSDLFELELTLDNANYPVTVTFYNNRYIIQKDNDDKCTQIEESEHFIKMQKILAIYKQYQQNDILSKSCDDFKDNLLLNTRFSYFCVTPK